MTAAQLLAPANRQLLTDILTLHVIPGSALTAAAVTKTPVIAQTLNLNGTLSIVKPW